MPFVTLPAEEDVEIYYEWYEQKFDPSKPTALFLPPAITCSALIHQYVLPRLPKVTSHFNCLSLDLRGHGRTKNPARKGMDCFVFAADIAFVLNALHIRAVHLVGHSYVGCPTAFAFSILFPSAVLSLSILGCAPLNSMPSQLPALMELLEGWLQGEDEEALFDSMNAILDLAFTASSRPGDANLRDWLSNMWFRRIGPHQALRCFGVTAPVLLNPEITREELGSIECPVLLVQGTDDMMRDIPFAQDILSGLNGTEEATLEIVDGGVCYVGIANLEESGPLLSRFLVSQKSLPLPSIKSSSSIPFPTPRHSISSSSSCATRGVLDSFAWSRFDHAEPLVEQLWQLCNHLDGNALVTFADRERQPWELGGRIDEVSAFKWRFSQRNRNERTLTNSRRGSVPQIKQDCATTVVTFEDVPLPGIDYESAHHHDQVEEEERGNNDDRVDNNKWTTTRDGRGFSSNLVNACRRSGGVGCYGGGGQEDGTGDRIDNDDAKVQFRMDTWKWETVPTPAPFTVRENGIVLPLPSSPER